MIGAYFTHKGASAQHVTPTNFNNTLKSCVVVLGLSRYNIHPADVSSHSLRAGVPVHSTKQVLTLPQSKSWDAGPQTSSCSISKNNWLLSPPTCPHSCHVPPLLPTYASGHADLPANDLSGAQLLATHACTQASICGTVVQLLAPYFPTHTGSG
jgi:hypothetical protein